MKRRLSWAVGLICGSALAVGASAATGPIRLSLSQARAIALKARPGTVRDEELEKEAGGRGFRYSFDIVSSGATYEVGVDAKTGKIIENGHESAATEGAEQH